MEFSVENNRNLNVKGVDLQANKIKTESHTFHIGYIKCPKCGVGGQLTARIEKWRNHFNGPYYHVKHTKSIYKAKQRKKLREQGFSSVEIEQSSKTFNSVYTGVCYIGQYLTPDLIESNKENINRVHSFINTEDDSLIFSGKTPEKINRIAKKCANCNKTLHLLPSQTNRHFCSDECRLQYINNHTLTKTLSVKEFMERKNLKKIRRKDYIREYMKQYWKKHPRKRQEKDKRYYNKHSTEKRLKARIYYYKKKGDSNMVTQLTTELKTISQE